MSIPANRRTRVNKNDLVQKLAARTTLSKMDAQKVVDDVFNVITDSLKAGDEVRVSGFGVFVVSARAGSKGRNPKTGEEITIKASKAARFRAGKPLKDALNAE
jgi:DNA-binding protein HU-beta